MVNEGRYSDARSGLGEDRFEELRKAKLLVVGSGGIGCELLKNLVLVGCESITTIDLDTIDVSNLNRQFLFRKRHVGMSKAEVAREVCLDFNPLAKIEAERANIKETRFGIEWFSQFAAVINALDNVEARRHVNRMCLASKVPLIEAGTTGYLGQVFCIVKGETACYECFPKPQKKVYPICTIRSTPEKPVHCIVWAKELFKLAFGLQEESMLYDDAEDSRQRSVFGEAVSKLRTDSSFDALNSAFLALFHTEIIRQIKLEEEKPDHDTTIERQAIPDFTIHTALRSTAPSNTTLLDDRAVWSVDESLTQLAYVCQRLKSRYDKGENSVIEFDKDDKDTMIFVAAAANVRAANYVKIPLQSLHDAKGIAGNIIPAIATTNAIIAGLQTSQLVKLLALKATGQYPEHIRERCAYVSCSRLISGRGKLLLTAARLDPPQPNCYVCRSSQIDLGLDMTTMNLKQFVDTVLIGHLSFVKPALDLGDSGLYDPDDSRLAPFLMKPLTEISGLTSGTVLTATDFATDLELAVVVHHKPKLDPEKYPLAFALLDDLKADEASDSTNKKRSLSQDVDEEQPPLKTQKTSNGQKNDAIL